MKTILVLFALLQISIVLCQDVNFLVFTQSKPNKTQDITTITDSSFYRKHFKFIIHGFEAQPGPKHKWINLMKDTYLTKPDTNVVIVDWSKLSGKELDDYENVTHSVDEVGVEVMNYIVNLHQKGANLRKIHLVGHSLGSHISGIAGNLLKEQNKKIARITGLDPAWPEFTEETPLRISTEDADFVDIIHTSYLGLQTTVGDADFFVNNHLNQPGCLEEGFAEILEAHKFDIGSCSHTRACKYFIESIKSSGFIATQCDRYNNYKKDKCKGNPTAVMGENVNTRVRGKFYVKTNGKSPYAKFGAL